MEYTYTYNQCLAFAKVLLEIMSADNEISESESELFSEIADAFGLSDEDILKANRLNILKCLTELKNLPEKEKVTLGAFMVGMVNADGAVCHEESGLLKMVCDLTNIPLPK